MMRTFGGNPIEGIRAVPQEKIIIIDNKGKTQIASKCLLVSIGSQSHKRTKLSINMCSSYLQAVHIIEIGDEKGELVDEPMTSGIEQQ